jgi:hypothetical protein
MLIVCVARAGVKMARALWLPVAWESWAPRPILRHWEEGGKNLLRIALFGATVRLYVNHHEEHKTTREAR